MKKITKILILTILLSFMGCSKNAYVKTIENGYSKSKEDASFYTKDDNDDNYIYTKKKTRYTVYENQHFLVLKEDKITHEKSLCLALKYRGSNWIYMNGLDLISDKTYHIDFMTRKLNSALWRDKSNLIDSVEEYIAFTLTPEEINALKELVDTGHGNIKYYSEVKGKSGKSTLTPEEIQNMKEILNLYFK